jgi:hypothetical protein
MLVSLVVLNMCKGEGGVDGLGGSGSNFNLHLICDTEFLYCYAAGI